MKNEIKRALISVYDKTGLEDLARALGEAGVEIVVGVGPQEQPLRDDRQQRGGADHAGSRTNHTSGPSTTSCTSTTRPSTVRVA